jgi:hypothetical protein
MERIPGRALVAKVGAVVFAGALGLASVLSPATARASFVYVASSVELATDVATLVSPGGTRVSALGAAGGSPIANTLIDLLDVPMVPAGTAILGAASSVEEPVRAGPAPVVAPPPQPPAPRSAAPASAAPAPTFPPPEPLVLDGVVVASWYGPGFYGNKTACGQTYTPEIVGVAHRLLPCGTLVKITSPAGKIVTVPVIDRGPYIAGRSLDLSNATRLELACTDLCRVRMQVQ